MGVTTIVRLTGEDVKELVASYLRMNGHPEAEAHNVRFFSGINERTFDCCEVLASEGDDLEMPEVAPVNQHTSWEEILREVHERQVNVNGPEFSMTPPASPGQPFPEPVNPWPGSNTWSATYGEILSRPSLSAQERDRLERLLENAGAIGPISDDELGPSSSYVGIAASFRALTLMKHREERLARERNEHRFPEEKSC